MCFKRGVKYTQFTRVQHNGTFQFPQILYDVLFKPESAGDPGSMCSNMNITNNINAKTKNVLDNFNYCKDFVEVETDAFIVAAAMRHFDMTSLEDDQVVPEGIKNASKAKQRLWLHEQAKDILETFVMKSQTEECRVMVETVVEANERKVFFCHVCDKRYFYEKSRDNHVRKQHPESMTSESVTEDSDINTTENEADHIYNYACVRLSFGMLLRNFSDAVKEGDGGRIIRCWKFLLLIYKANNHSKYAFAALHLLANTISLLTPQQANCLVWNRTVSNKGGAGSNISLDLRMEHIVHLLKELLANLGVNLTPEAATRCSSAVKSVEDLLSTVDSQLEVRRPSGRHTVSRSKADFEAIVKELHDRGEVFANRPQDKREYTCFRQFKTTMLGNLNYTKLNSWINRHKKEWSKRL